MQTAFFDRYANLLPPKEYELFLKYINIPLRKSIRINTNKISVKDFMRIIKPEWWKLTPIPWCKTWFWIDRDNRELALWKHELHEKWFFYIQESSSMIPPEILAPKPWETILDISSSPWSKTTQISALMKNTGLLVANEPINSRVKSLKSNITRLNCTNTIITEKDWRVFSQYFPNFFDKVLVDAPCTWEWTIRKDKHALDNWNPKAVIKLSILQKMLIEEAFHSLRPWGILVYSTCTHSPEENEEVVEYLLNANPQAKLQPIKSSWITKQNSFMKWTLRIWPQDYNSEGFFVAKIKKTAPTQSTYYKNIKPWKRKNNSIPLSSNYFKLIIESIFDDNYKDIKAKYKAEIKNFEAFLSTLTLKGSEIHLVPKWAETITNYISINSDSTLLWKIIWNYKVKWTQEWEYILSKYIESNLIDLKPLRF